MSAYERLAVDIVILAAVIAAANPVETGLGVHEWIGLSLTVPALVHLVVNWDWVARAVGQFFRRAKAMPRVNLIVDAGLFVSLVGVTLSGLLVVPGLAASLGVNASGAWHSVHLITSDFTVAFTVAHLALHARWIVDVGRRMVGSASSGLTATESR